MEREMHAKKFSYDPDCEKLAEMFLSDAARTREIKRCDGDAADLAQDIQDAVEAWFRFRTKRIIL
jgi:hypothetical protein